MKRREFITLVGGAAVSPLAARTVRAAEPKGPFRIAVAEPSSAPLSDIGESSNQPKFAALFMELRRLGYIEGKNLVVLRFSAGGDPARFSSVVQDVVNAAPDVVVASSNGLVLRLKAATSTTPIVAITSDPLATGIVSSIARPAGNITGVSIDAGLGIMGKRLALLLEVIPSASRIGYLSPELSLNDAEGIALRDAAQQASVSLVGSGMRGVSQEAEFQRVFGSLRMENAQGLIVLPTPEIYTRRQLVVDLVATLRLPTIYPYREFVEAGGLMAYGLDLPDAWRRLAGYVDRILNGAKPGDLPIYQATKLSLVVNMKAARTLGLNPPSTLLAQADEVIE
jgi:putative tryptophan/tyrosine transport system substrate-binding protein